ncbi:MAG: neutral/alkaline non-lysosomal ceramidase N-terminal domain-containing protein [Bryobacteraceae bacterium]
MLNSSHTHTGPVVRPNLQIMYNFDAHNQKVVDEYSQFLTGKIVAVVGEAVGKLAPATLSFGEGNVNFAVNRREPVAKGIRIGLNPKGPVDHTVPLVRVRRPDGSIVAALFGYACHNTTLTGEHYQISGDYAGYAQAEIERLHPNTTAMFLMLCGADANPSPRGTMENVMAHGSALGNEVSRMLAQPLVRVRGKVKAAFEIRDLPLSPHTKETFEAMLTDQNVYRSRLAKQTLQAYAERRPPRSVPFPVQAIRLGKNLALVALGGEVVVEYALQLKRRYPKINLIVAGYSNDVMAYIPTAAMLKEGGYEPIDSMVYYGHPAPFAAEVEPVLYDSIYGVMKRVGLSASPLR